MREVKNLEIILSAFKEMKIPFEFKLDESSDSTFDLMWCFEELFHFVDEILDNNKVDKTRNFIGEIPDVLQPGFIVKIDRLLGKDMDLDIYVQTFKMVIDIVKKM